MKKFLATLLAVALVAVACCVFASAEDTNLALNKSYTTSTVRDAWPDEGGKTLTDGVKSKTGEEFSAGDAVWTGFNGNDIDKDAGEKSEIVVDLGEVCTVKAFSVELCQYSEWGIAVFNIGTAEFLYSADGENWTSTGEGAGSVCCEVNAETDKYDDGVHTYSLTLDSAVAARYVKVAFAPYSWAFISEFEAFGTTGAGTTDESKSETESKTESEAVSSAAPVESSAAATSSTASSTPSTSDAGVFAVVVLAVVAVIGAAVVVKKRA